MTSAEIKLKLESAVTEWDIKQSGKRGYNPNALYIMLKSIDDNVMPFIESGKDLKTALSNGFQDRILTFLEKKMGI